MYIVSDVMSIMLDGHVYDVGSDMVIARVCLQLDLINDGPYVLGHQRPVTDLVMSQHDDHFMSAAADDAVRLWDLRSPNCVVLCA